MLTSEQSVELLISIWVAPSVWLLRLVQTWTSYTGVLIYTCTHLCQKYWRVELLSHTMCFCSSSGDSGDHVGVHSGCTRAPLYQVWRRLSAFYSLACSRYRNRLLPFIVPEGVHDNSCRIDWLPLRSIITGCWINNAGACSVQVSCLYFRRVACLLIMLGMSWFSVCVL